MAESAVNNSRIAKNTILLYARMVLLLLVSLYTSRVVLSALGFEDYGIYNVVGGVVAMFSFINMALANSTTRFITYALGKGDIDNSRIVFTSSVIAHIIIAVLIVLLSETIGLWFLNNKMVIPAERMHAANWVFQFSVVACVVSILYVPFNSLIIAHEKMNAFAFISIIEAVLKLLIVFLITALPHDRLVLYALLLLCVNVVTVCIYSFYCRRHFAEAVFCKIKDHNILKELLGFAGWSTIGNLAYVGYTQGLNILLNVFFGPVVNAARGVATQVQGAVIGFVTNFQMAVNPQITKSYAQENYDGLHSLIYTSSKCSFFLLYCIILPLSIKAGAILDLWLEDVPQYAVQFTILTLFARLIDTLSNPIGIANNATGTIRKYQIFEGGTLMLIVPVAYIILKRGGNPVSVFWVQLIIMYIAQFVRLELVCHKIKMRISTYCSKVLFKIIPVALLAPVLPIIMNRCLEENWFTTIAIIVTSVVLVLAFSYSIGLEKEERIMVRNKINAYIRNIRS